MKKILTVLVFVFAVTLNLYAVDIVPKFSVDLPSTFKTDYEVKVSVGFSAEARVPVSHYFSVGGGLEYLLPRTISPKMVSYGIEAPYANRKFSFLPIYATVIFYPFGNFGEYKPYLRVDGGHNLAFNIDDAKDCETGYYVSGGIGFEMFEKFILELTMARYEAKDNDTNITYKKISFKGGYKFSL